ncbi:hypothetical protein [Staphylococcus borealis]|uniref:hypothetical protein n=1 Tax=Staphylococcus borealis TaxID=2742203 RepID=UPI002A801A29|nr:hypothetical protein [Staphylococcus borealis]MDY4021128.1 hypothetical protein [Staphylococcus borealis]
MADLYQKTVKKIADLSYDWSRFTDKTIVISGATGMIGTFMIDVLMYLNTEHRLNLTIYALGRSETKAQKRFVNHWGHQNFHFLGSIISVVGNATSEVIGLFICMKKVP